MGASVLDPWVAWQARGRGRRARAIGEGREGAVGVPLSPRRIGKSGEQRARSPARLRAVLGSCSKALSARCVRAWGRGPGASPGAGQEALPLPARADRV